MPTYQNRSGQMVTIGDVTFSSGETKPVDQQYLSLVSADRLVIKVSDEPPLRNNFFTIFEGISSPTNMTEPRLFRHSVVLQVKNHNISDSTVGKKVTIVAFASVTDNPLDCIPIKYFEFICQDYLDTNGNSIPLWYCLDPLLKRDNIDPYSELIWFSVVDIEATVNVLVKSY